MTIYPDPDDATAARRGSDHDRAEAWRVLALSERNRADRAEAENERLRKVLGKYGGGVKGMVRGLMEP